MDRGPKHPKLHEGASADAPEEARGEVVVSNLPSPYMEISLKGQLERALRRAGRCSTGLSIGTYSPDKNVVVVTLPNSEISTVLCGLSITWLKKKLQISHAAPNTVSPQSDCKLDGTDHSTEKNPIGKENQPDASLTRSVGIRKKKKNPSGANFDKPVKSKSAQKNVSSSQQSDCEFLDCTDNSQQDSTTRETPTEKVSQSNASLPSTSAEICKEDFPSGSFNFEKTLETKFVKISNIPGPFVEALFIPFLEGERMDAGVEILEQEVVVSCSAYDSTEKSVIIEFCSPEIAEQMSLLNLIYVRNKLEILLYFPPGTIDFEKTLETKFVKISNIPGPFVEALFIPFLEGERMDAGVEILEQEVVVSCSAYDSTEKSVIIEFSSHEIAEQMSLLNLIYIRNKLEILLYFPPGTNDFEKTMETKFVKISNITGPFVEALFIPFLEGERMDAGVEILEQEVVVSCSAYDSTEKSVIIEFCSPEIAEQMSLLNLIYVRNKLEFSLYFPPGTIDFEKTLETKFVKISNIPPPSTESSATRVDWTLHTQLVLLKCMLNNRKDLASPATQVKGAAFKKVMSGLKEAGFSYTESSIRKRMKGLLTEPPKEAVLCVKEYLGEVPEGTSKIDELIKQYPDEPKKYSTKPAGRKMQAGFMVVLDDYVQKDNKHLFPGDSEAKLLEAYLSLKHKFDDDKTRSSTVYSEILVILHSAGFSHLRLEDLSTRLGTLAQEFKLRYDSMLNQTGCGTEPMNWPHFDILSRIWENSVLIEPQKIRSFGSSFANFSRNVRANSASGSKAVRDKPSSNKFLGTRHNENVQLKQDFLEQMKRQNDLLEKQIELKK